jgi:hypothetical protein
VVSPLAAALGADVQPHLAARVFAPAYAPNSMQCSTRRRSGVPGALPRRSGAFRGRWFARSRTGRPRPDGGSTPGWRAARWSTSSSPPPSGRRREQGCEAPVDRTVVPQIGRSMGPRPAAADAPGRRSYRRSRARYSSSGLLAWPDDFQRGPGWPVFGGRWLARQPGGRRGRRSCVDDRDGQVRADRPLRPAWPASRRDTNADDSMERARRRRGKLPRPGASGRR